MKFAIIATILIVGLLSSCERKNPVVLSLKIGDSVTNYNVGKRWGTTQDKLITAVRPLWDGLSSGVSQEFQLVSTSPMVIDPSIKKEAKAKYGKEITFTSTMSRTSPRWRFFRNRDGMSGIDSVHDAGSRVITSGSDKSVDWPSIEICLRDALFEAYRVGLVDEK